MGDGAAILTVLLVGAILTGTLNACGGSSGGETVSKSPPAPGFAKGAKLAAFGAEASEAESQDAGQTLEENQISRDLGHFAAQCETLAASVVEELERSSGGKRCGEVLRLEAKGKPRVLLEDSFVGPVESLRVEGNVGYALYHGKYEKEYAMKMERENGEWKVVSVRNELIR
jgi:hypothetical protein